MTTGTRNFGRGRGRSRIQGSTAWNWLLLGLAAGCAGPGKPLVESPWSIERQQQAVLEVVPRGTPRDDAGRRLKAAGIEFTPGGNGSIFYLSLWHRPDGTRWHINVALLFDAAGNLYETRTADSATGLVARETQDGLRRSTGAKPVDAPLRETDAPEPTDEGLARVPFPGQTSPLRSATP